MIYTSLKLNASKCSRILLVVITQLNSLQPLYAIVELLQCTPFAVKWPKHFMRVSRKLGSNCAARPMPLMRVKHLWTVKPHLVSGRCFMHMQHYNITDRGW